MENAIFFELRIIFKLFLSVLEEYCPQVFRRFTRRAQVPNRSLEPPSTSAAGAVSAATSSSEPDSNAAVSFTTASINQE
uniref:Uncharacterized protein n=1 Tax=Strongyloides venezuelensis TaxID=75913 RepID=A0A0K0FJV0_STRVS